MQSPMQKASDGSYSSQLNFGAELPPITLAFTVVLPTDDGSGSESTVTARGGVPFAVPIGMQPGSPFILGEASCVSQHYCYDDLGAFAAVLHMHDDIKVCIFSQIQPDCCDWNEHSASPLHPTLLLKQALKTMSFIPSGPSIRAGSDPEGESAVNFCVRSGAATSVSLCLLRTGGKVGTLSLCHLLL